MPQLVWSALKRFRRGDGFKSYVRTSVHGGYIERELPETYEHGLAGCLRYLIKEHAQQIISVTTLHESVGETGYYVVVTTCSSEVVEVYEAEAKKNARCQRYLMQRGKS